MKMSFFSRKEKTNEEPAKKKSENKNQSKSAEKNGLTELVFILDRSGSMGGLESDTIGGFNSMIEKQKKEEGDAVVTTVLFDNEYEKLHDRVPLQSVQPMTDKDYYVRGSTALLDAIGKIINHISHIQKTLNEGNIPEHTIFVITTDGLENASREYNAAKIKKLINDMKQRHQWEFIFLGANIDAIETAKTIGISADRAANFHSDSAGQRLNYEVMSETIGAFRRNESVGSEWKARIEEDFENRKS